VFTSQKLLNLVTLVRHYKNGFTIGIFIIFFKSSSPIAPIILNGIQINLYLEQPMEIQLFATFFQRRK
jgi:hypothetical protein